MVEQEDVTESESGDSDHLYLGDEEQDHLWEEQREARREEQD